MVHYNIENKKTDDQSRMERYTVITDIINSKLISIENSVDIEIFLTKEKEKQDIGIYVIK